MSDDCLSCAHYLGLVGIYHRCASFHNGIKRCGAPERFTQNAVETGLPPHWRLHCTYTSCDFYEASTAGTIETGPLPLEDGCG